MVAHPALLRGAGSAARLAGPVILKRSTDDAVRVLLDDLGDHDGLTSVMTTRSLPQHAGGALTLYQPVHRVLHVALVELVCDRVGMPRMDPARIDSAGLVLRRRPLNAADQLEGWMRETPTPASRANGGTKKRLIRGWLPFTGTIGGPTSDLDLDPDPGRRVGALGTGRPELDLRILVARGGDTALAERVIPLFPAPPETGKATGKTLLYGILPLSGGEQSDLPDEPGTFDLAVLSAHLPQLLRGGLAASIPNAGDSVGWSDTKGESVPDDITLFVTQLRQIAVEMDAFGTSPEAQALYKAIDSIQLPFYDQTSTAWPFGIVYQTAGQFLKEAARVLVQGDDQSARVQMPIVWTALSTDQAQNILDAAASAMRARIKTMVPRAPQFTDPTREYRLRAFVRVKCPDGCPPNLVWSDYSDPFTIAPWYAPSDAPPAIIPLPDAMDRDALKQMKPNVAFVVPQKLADMLNGNDPKKLASGGGTAGASGIALDWICSFNIPVITLCAFIVLNIFLSLFDLIFRWMMFIKICIPIPKKA